MGELSAKALMYKLSDEFKDVNHKLNVIENNQDDVRNMVRRLNDKINDPDTGIIVKTNRNTEFREVCEPERAKLLTQFDSVLRWKGTIQWVLYTIGVAIIGATVKLIFFP